MNVGQGRNGGREGMPGRGMQQLQQQLRQPKAKKQKEVPDTPVRPWRPLNEQEVLDGARQAPSPLLCRLHLTQLRRFQQTR